MPLMLFYRYCIPQSIGFVMPSGIIWHPYPVLIQHGQDALVWWENHAKKSDGFYRWMVQNKALCATQVPRYCILLKGSRDRKTKTVQKTSKWEEPLLDVIMRFHGTFHKKIEYLSGGQKHYKRKSMNNWDLKEWAVQKTIKKCMCANKVSKLKYFVLLLLLRLLPRLTDNFKINYPTGFCN